LRIAVISDIHSNLPALEAVKGHIEKSRAEMVICAGDVVGYGASPNECCRSVASLVTHMCLGNHDLAALRREVSDMNPYAARAALWTADVLDEPSRTYLTKMEESSRFVAGRLQVAVHHGSLRNVSEYLYAEDITEGLLTESDAQALVFGHTHVPYAIRYPEGMVINPGSVGQPRDGDPRASLALLETSPLSCRTMRVEYDIDAAADAIREAGLPEMLADRLYRGH